MEHTPRPIAIAVEEAGGQQPIADECGVSQALVSQWLNDRTAIDIRHFPGILKCANGRVTLEQLVDDQLARPARLGERKRA